MTCRLLFALVGFAACSSTPKQTVPAPPPTGEQAPVVVAPEPDPAAPALRLPGDVKPIRQRIDMTIVPATARVTGTAHIDATVEKATRVVWLNATDLKIAHAELAGKPARVIAGGEDFIGLVADAPLATGALAIDLAFDAAIDPTRSRGIYVEKEGAEPYVYTFFEPIDARRAFPCFDEPSYKIPWQLTFHVKQDHVALANAAVAKETAEPDGMKRVELAESKPLPSYLVAFVVGPFEVIDGGTGGRAKTPIHFIVPKGRSGELGWAKQVTPRVVAALEDYFDMDYPYGKLDVAVVPRYWGTMEHPGIVAMGQPLTLIRPDQETRARKQAYANILAHELSHYWFGDFVTMAWWDDTWLNEALGEWMDMIITHAVEPSWRYREDRVDISEWAMAADETLAAQAIRQPVTSKEAIAASFDGAITYAKGASVLRMFEASVGPTKFRQFIRDYLHAHAWGNATWSDFIEAMTASLKDQSPHAALETFVTHPGVPLIKATIACTPDKPVISLTKRRSLPMGVQEPDPKTWNVVAPVCLRFGDATRTMHVCQRVFGDSLSIDLSAVTDAADPKRWHGCPTWVFANEDAYGYYRSWIDPATARDLFDPKSKLGKLVGLDPAERMMTVADLRAMVSRGELPLDKLLEIVPLVANDKDPKVAGWALEAASFHADALPEPLFLAARKWFAKTFGASARTLGWHRAKTDSDERHALRQQHVPMIARTDDKLGAEGERLADRWIEDRTGLDDELVGGALRVAAYRGDAARFDRFVAAAKSARDRTEQQRILGALGGFRDPVVVKRALELVLTKEFDARDTMSIVQGLLYARDTRDQALTWLAAHIDELLGRMRDDEASWALGAIAGGYCDVERRKIAAELTTPRAAKIDGAQAAVARGLEKSDQCITELARQLPALERALK
jgi:aminopeptidase N